MAGIDHAVHPSTISSERYDMCRESVRKDGYWARDMSHRMQPPKDVWTWVADRGSKECRYDLSESDPKCEGCKQRGVGRAYDEFVRREGT